MVKLAGIMWDRYARVGSKYPPWVGEGLMAQMQELQELVAADLIAYRAIADCAVFFARCG